MGKCFIFYTKNVIIFSQVLFMNENNLINYYNKFNEEKRLKTRHGYLEFQTTIHYILKYLKKGDKVIDIGAGAGAYSKYLSDLGYEIEAVELIKHNVRKIEKLGIKTTQANAVNLSTFEDNTFDITLLLGPMYHLISNDELIKALSEAKRITKKNGIIFVQYCMNEYAILTHGFKEHAIMDSLKNNLIDNDYNITPRNTDLYRYVRLEDIEKFNKELNLKRLNILTPDGLVHYMRSSINELTEEEYQELIKYHLSICERKDLLGACYHVLDIIKK